MLQTNSSLPSLPLRLSALQIVGLTRPAAGDWARLRALQYRDLHRAAITRITIHSMAALVAISLFNGLVPPLLLGCWVLALALGLAHQSKVESGLADIDHRLMKREEFTRHAIAVAAMAVLWSVPILAFVPFAGVAEHFAIWTVVAMLMAGTACIVAQVPMSTFAYACIVGPAGAFSFFVSGDYSYAVASLVFSIMVVVGALENAHTFLSAKIAEVGAAEKDEVVSLLLREFEENEADWLWQVDIRRNIKAASPRFAFALGKDPKELEGKSFVECVAGENWNVGNFPPSLHELAEKLKNRESFSNLLIRVDVAEGRRWWEISGKPIFDDLGKFSGFRGVGSDVTEKQESDEKIAYLARYDTLTGLPNRLMLTEAMSEGLAYAEKWKSKCAFMMIDLDRFKAVNDSLGHQVGDRLLAQVSYRLKTIMSENVQVGRLGGDEFAVVIRDASNRDVVADLARHIIEMLSAHYEVENHKLYIGASVGSAMGPRDGNNVETLMRNADLALYQAKDLGGGEHCHFMPSLHTDAEEKRTLETSLRSAIDNEELTLNFQPVVNTKSEQVVSFEALLRWNSEEHGFVSPGKFIPLAEDTRLIVPIGDWVLREACKEASRWPEDIKIAVNVSGEQLLEPNFSSNVVRALADSGLPAHRLEVEVTESVFLRDGRTARQTLEEIMALGCTIALDDFGTGYSSLGYLRNLRFSTIKVDRSFVQGAAQNSPESIAIIRAVVAMAQSLEMSTTAEGVEDGEQATMIREMGCTKIQGYYFGRPMSAKDAYSLLFKRRNVAA